MDSLVKMTKIDDLQRLSSLIANIKSLTSDYSDFTNVSLSNEDFVTLVDSVCQLKAFLNKPRNLKDIISINCLNFSQEFELLVKRFSTQIDKA